MADRTETPRSMGDYDAPHASPATPAEDIRTVVINQITWSAVFAGVVTSLAVQIILNLLGLGIGAATIDPAGTDTPEGETLSIVAAIWWTASGIIAAAIGGYVAGRTSGKPKENTGGFHGLAAWATTTLLIFYMLTTSVGAVVGGLYSTVSGVVEQTAGGAAQGAAATPNAVEQLKGKAQELTGQSPTSPSPETKQQAAEAAETAATAVSTGGIVAAIALVLGAIAAWFGGRAGTVEPTITTSAMMGRRRP